MQIEIHVAKGLIEGLKSLVMWTFRWLLLFFAISIVVHVSPLFRDDSDEPGWLGGRSGVLPSVDQLTGCEYLRTSAGGITPRLDGYGRHVGCRR